MKPVGGSDGCGYAHSDGYAHMMVTLIVTVMLMSVVVLAGMLGPRDACGYADTGI